MHIKKWHQKISFNFRKWFKSTLAEIKLRVHSSAITDDILERASTLLSLSEMYLEPCQTSKMEPFAKMINGFQLLNSFAEKLA